MFAFLFVVVVGVVADDVSSAGLPDTVNLIVEPAGTSAAVYTWNLKFWIVCTPSSVSEVLSAFIPSGRKTVRLLTGSTNGCATSNFSSFGTVVKAINPYAFSLGGIPIP